MIWLMPLRFQSPMRIGLVDFAETAKTELCCSDGGVVEAGKAALAEYEKHRSPTAVEIAQREGVVSGDENQTIKVRQSTAAAQQMSQIVEIRKHMDSPESRRCSLRGDLPK